MSRSAYPPRSDVTMAIVGTALVVVYALTAAVQILLLNPLAAVPGSELAEIYGEVAAAGESMAIAPVLVSLAVGPAIAIGLLARVWRRPGGQLSHVAAWYLGLVALGSLAYFWASFGPGMSLADTYYISGGDHSTWATPLHVASGIAFVALIVLALGGVGRLRGPRRSTLRPWH